MNPLIVVPSIGSLTDEVNDKLKNIKLSDKLDILTIEQVEIIYRLTPGSIKEYFEHIETGSTTGSIKHLCMSSIIEKWGILPKETIYIGDSPTDITDAKKAGVMPISACWASTANKEELIKLEPYKLFENVLALKNWIKTLI